MIFENGIINNAIKIITFLIIFTTISYAEPVKQTLKRINWDKDWKWVVGLNVSSALLKTSHAGFIKMPSDVKEYKKETISGEVLAIPTIALPFGITAWGDEKDSFNHFKGYWVAFSAQAFIVETVKFAVERKRPDYDDALAKDKKTDKRSFYSGHSSQSFAIGTYIALYSYNHSTNLVYKYGIPILAEVTAGWIAWTRVNNNWHHTNDAVAGSTAGATIAAITYNIYDKKPEESKLSLKINPNYIGLTYNF